MFRDVNPSCLLLIPLSNVLESFGVPWVNLLTNAVLISCYTTYEYYLRLSLLVIIEIVPFLGLFTKAADVREDFFLLTNKTVL